MQSKNQKPFEEFLREFKEEMADLFGARRQDAKRLHSRLFSDDELNRIMKHTPLSVAIPTEYGGRGVKVRECLAILEAASYESLPLSLTFGINIALFLEPTAKYATETAKKRILPRFIDSQRLGGLMISEPDFGSDALNIQTFFTPQDDGFKLCGTKHWQGLSGMADYWLVATREKKSDGTLGRDFGIFLTDRSVPGQDIPCVKIYNNNGLYPIPYGINEINVHVPKDQKLVPESTGIKLIMDLLHRSRLQFPGMSMGILRRMLEEATDYCRNRLIRGNSLYQFDNVQFQIAQMQSAFTICAAMCRHSSLISGIEENLAGLAVQANSMKTRITDLMQKAAHTTMQLMGAQGFHIESLGSRTIMDSRPFQIFEGPNEMLYSQISEAVVKEVSRKKLKLIEYFENLEVTKGIASFFNNILDIHVQKDMLQRKHVILGEVISRVITAGYVQQLEDSGFNKSLISNTLDMIHTEASNLINAFKTPCGVSPLEDFAQESDWKSFV